MNHGAFGRGDGGYLGLSISPSQRIMKRYNRIACSTVRSPTVSNASSTTWRRYAYFRDIVATGANTRSVSRTTASR